MDEWMDAWMEAAWMDGWDGWMDDAWMGGLTGRMDGRMDGLKDGGTHVRTGFLPYAPVKRTLCRFTVFW
jgi:hypothetical protein